ERAALQENFRKTADGAMVLREHRRLVDRVLKEMWRQLRLPAPLALLAVGGYGRGELYPHSDIDVLVLLQDPASDGLAGQIEKLVGRLWDTALELAHSVRTVAACACIMPQGAVRTGCCSITRTASRASSGIPPPRTGAPASS